MSEEEVQIPLWWQNIPLHCWMGPRSTGTAVVEERLRGQLGLAGLGPEPIAAVAAHSEDFCFVLHGSLNDAFHHIVRIGCFRAAVAAAGNVGLHLEPFELRSAC